MAINRDRTSEASQHKAGLRSTHPTRQYGASDDSTSFHPGKQKPQPTVACESIGYDYGGGGGDKRVDASKLYEICSVWFYIESCKTKVWHSPTNLAERCLYCTRRFKPQGEERC